MNLIGRCSVYLNQDGQYVLPSRQSISEAFLAAIDGGSFCVNISSIVFIYNAYLFVNIPSNNQIVNFI